MNNSEGTKEIPDSTGAKLMFAKEPERSAQFLGALDHTYRKFWGPIPRSLIPFTETISRYLQTFDSSYLPLAEFAIFNKEDGVKSTSWPALLAWYQEIDSVRAVLIFTKAWEARRASDRHGRDVLEAISSHGGSGFIPLLKEIHQEGRKPENWYWFDYAVYGLARHKDMDLRLELDSALANPATSEEERYVYERALEAYRPEPQER